MFTAIVAAGFLIGTSAVAIMVTGVERDAKAVQPAE